MLHTTGVGSLPHKQIKDAVLHVLTYYPAIPFWPQSSGSTSSPDMITQFFPARHLLHPSGLALSVRGDNPELLSTTEEILEQSPYEADFPLPIGIETLQELVKTVNSAELQPLALKVQITGLFTMSNLKDSTGRRLAEYETTTTLLEEVLFACAKRLIFFAQKANTEVWLQIDEPSFPATDKSPLLPFAVDAIMRMIERIKLFFPQVKVGVHACGQRNLQPLLSIPEIDFLSAELESVQINSVSEWIAEQNKTFIAGIVDPLFFTPEPDQETITDLVALIAHTAEAFASEQEALRRILISPNCGLLRLSVAQAEAIARQLVMLRNAVFAAFAV